MIKLCTVCFSKGRMLYDIDQYRDIYEAIVSPPHGQIQKPSLCFECVSVLKRCRRFQRNAVEAQEKLKLLGLYPPNVAALSSIETYSKLGFSRIKHINTDMTYPTQQSKGSRAATEPRSDPLSESLCKIEPIQTRDTDKQLSEKKTMKLIKLPSEMLTKLNLLPSAELAIKHQTASGLLKKIVLVPANRRTDGKTFPGEPKQLTQATVHSTGSKVKTRLSTVTPKRFNKNAKKSTTITKSTANRKERPISEPSGSGDEQSDARHISDQTIKEEFTDKSTAKLKERPVSETSESEDDQRDSRQISDKLIRKEFNKMLKNSGIQEDNLEMVKIHVMSDEVVEARRQMLRSEEQFVKSEYKCTKCIIGYYTEQQLEDHVKCKHVKRDPAAMLCPVCETYVPPASYVFHYGRHKVLYECTACAEYVCEPPRLARHFATRHSRGHRCGQCLRVFTLEVNLQRHITKKLCRSVADKKFICDICQKGFRQKFNLKKHIESHTAAKNHQCVTCDKWYKTPETLAAHIKYKHDRDPAVVYRCEQCDLTFASQLNLKYHLKRSLKHGADASFTNVCEQCGKAFGNLRDLENHINYKHKGVTEHVCPHCSKMYSCAAGLRKHVKHVHEGLKYEKSHACKVCGKRFTSTKTAKEHVYIHTGARPFRCRHCGDTFRQSAALYTHTRLVHLRAGGGRRARRGKKGGEE